MSSVSVIVTAYLERSKPYLDFCVESIRNLREPPHETLIVAPRAYNPQYDGMRTISPPQDAYWNARALNFGAQHATGDYLLMVNDDVVFTRDSVAELVNASRALDDRAIVMPISNDTNLNLYALATGVRPGPAKLAEWVSMKDALMATQSPYPMGFIFARTLCLFAVLIPRAIFDQVGLFDDSRKGHDDVDYTLRNQQAGYLNAVALNSIIYHFGGVSADLTMSERDRKESLQSFNEKWGV